MKRFLFALALVFIGFYALAQTASPTPAASVAPVVQAVETAAQAGVSAAKQSLLSSLSPSMIPALIALQAAFGSLMSLLQNLLGLGAKTAAAAGQTTPTTKQKIFGALLWVVKAIGMNL